MTFLSFWPHNKRKCLSRNFFFDLEFIKKMDYWLKFTILDLLIYKMGTNEVFVSHKTHITKKWQEKSSPWFAFPLPIFWYSLSFSMVFSQRPLQGHFSHLHHHQKIITLSRFIISLPNGTDKSLGRQKHVIGKWLSH